MHNTNVRFTYLLTHLNTNSWSRILRYYSVYGLWAKHACVNCTIFEQDVAAAAAAADDDDVDVDAEG